MLVKSITEMKGFFMRSQSRKRSRSTLLFILPTMLVLAGCGGSSTEGSGDVEAVDTPATAPAGESAASGSDDGQPPADGSWGDHAGARDGSSLRAVVHTTGSPLEGQPMPPLDLIDYMNGEIDSVSELSGKVVMIDFWGTWCAPCLAAVPHNNQLYQRYRGRGFTILGVCGGPNQDAMASTAARYEILYPIAKDHTQQAAVAWNVTVWPTYALVDRSGVVRSIGLSDARKIEETILALLEEG